jgi:hypothetical protein
MTADLIEIRGTRRTAHPRTIIATLRCRYWQVLTWTRDDDALPIRVRVAAVDSLDVLLDFNEFMSEARRQEDRAFHASCRLYLRSLARTDGGW